MAKTFDFNKLKEKTMTVVLSDEEKTTLIIKTPNKALYESIESLENDIKNSEDDEEIEDALYNLSAKVMSHNKNKIEITPEKLKGLYEDIDYLVAFLREYTDFIGEYRNATNSKN